MEAASCLISSSSVSLPPSSPLVEERFYEEWLELSELSISSRLSRSSSKGEEPESAYSFLLFEPS
jgi:hypothetical protein